MRLGWMMLVLVGCEKESISFSIDEGSHDGSPRSVGGMETDASFDRSLSFDAFFHADAAYTTESASNQDDWNKLMGLCQADHQDNSIRLGWRYDPVGDAIELGYYGYLNGTRQSHELGAWPLESVIPVTLRFTSTGSTATADGVSASEVGAVDTSGTGAVTFEMRTVYFGGDETAPHDIHVDVRNISN